MSEFTKNVQQWVMTGLSILGEVFSEKQTAGQKHAISLLLSGQADSALRAVCYYVMSNQIYPPSEEALQHPMVTDAVERLKVSVTMCGLANMQPSWAAEYVKTRSTTTDIHKPAPEGTVKELAARYGKSISEIRKLKAENRLSELKDSTND